MRHHGLISDQSWVEVMKLEDRWDDRTPMDIAKGQAIAQASLKTFNLEYEFPEPLSALLYFKVNMIPAALECNRS
jgi:hypothetical protein